MAAGAVPEHLGLVRTTSALVGACAAEQRLRLVELCAKLQLEAPPQAPCATPRCVDTLARRNMEGRAVRCSSVYRVVGDALKWSG